MALPNLPWGEMLVSSGATGVLIKGLDYLAGRNRAKAYTMGAVDHAVATALKSVTDEVDRLNIKMVAVEQKHENCEEELERSRRDREELRREINNLMAGPPASYDARAMRNVGGGT